MSNHQLLQFADAKAQILKKVSTLPYQRKEKIKLSQAQNRIIADPIISPINVPNFNNSAMDGYAVRIQDIENNPLLPISATIYAGDDISQINWLDNSCIRIMTGAAVPDETDAVVMQEETTKQGDNILFPNHIKYGQNIRTIGENVKQNQMLFSQGERLTIAKLSTIAALGIEEITVYAPLKVMLFSTGNELVPIGEPLASNSQIYDSNRFTLNLMLKELGCQVVDLGIIKDDPILITQKLTEYADQVDMIITSGGVSVGDADFTKTVLEQSGNIHFWKIAMKPGKPFAFGQLGKTLFCGLPGNPVSTIVTFYQLVRPLIMALYGNKEEITLTKFKVKTTSDLKKQAGRIDFQRGYLYCDSYSELVVQSTGEQNSHITTSFNNANCFILLEAERGNIKAGEWVTVEPFCSPFL